MVDAIAARPRPWSSSPEDAPGRGAAAAREALRHLGRMRAPYEEARTRVLHRRGLPRAGRRRVRRPRGRRRGSDLRELGAIPDLARSPGAEDLSQPARARGAAAGRHRSHQPRHRGGAGAERAHGRPARQQHLRQARRLVARRRRRRTPSSASWSEAPAAGTHDAAARGWVVSPTRRPRAVPSVDARSRPRPWNTRRQPCRTTYDTIVIGAGQAGLSAGYHLAKQGEALPHPRRRRPGRRVVAEPLGLAAAVHAGDPRQPARAWSSAAATTFPHARTRWSTTSSGTSTTFDLPVRLGVRGRRAVPRGRGFRVTAGAEAFDAGNVILATGVHRVPKTPAFAADLSRGHRAAALGRLPQPRTARSPGPC